MHKSSPAASAQLEKNKRRRQGVNWPLTEHEQRAIAELHKRPVDPNYSPGRDMLGLYEPPPRPVSVPIPHGLDVLAAAAAVAAPLPPAAPITPPRENPEAPRRTPPTERMYYDQDGQPESPASAAAAAAVYPGSEQQGRRRSLRQIEARNPPVRLSGRQLSFR